MATITGGITATYTYNGDGDRYTQTVNGVTTDYVLDPSGLAQVLVETASGQSNFYVPGLAQYDGTNWQYFAKDRLGSVRQVVDPAGQLALAQTFDPFGNLLAQSGLGASAFGYTGEQTDPTGLVFLRARYYDPSVGRFLTADTVVPDPLRSMGWNGYAYIENNPIRFVDPSGHQCAVAAVDGALDPAKCIPEGAPFGGPSLSGRDLVKAIGVSMAVGGGAAIINNVAPPPEVLPLPGISLNDVEFSCLEVGPGGSGVDIWPPVITTPLDGSPFPTFYGTPLGVGSELLPNVWEIHKNDDTYVGHQGIYKIEIDGKLYKYGKADMTNVSNRTGTPIRLQTQINRLKRLYPGSKVTGRIIYQNKNISTLDIKAIETAYIQEYYDNHGTLPPDNQDHPGIEY